MANSRKYWVGFDLGGTKMMAVVYDGSLNPLSRKKRKTKAQQGEDVGLERIEKTIRGALDEADLSAGQLAGIGVGVPGPIDPERGLVLHLPNLGWEKVPLAKNLTKAFDVPVSMANDVDAGVYGEYTSGAARGAYSVVGLFPGTGIGGGCVYDGHILRGRSISCMEIGHMRVQPDGPLCGCGNRGCLEAVASRLSISAAAAAAAYRGEAPHLLEAAGMDLSNIRSSVLKAAVEAGDKAVEDIIRQAAWWLGVGVANVVNLMAPEIVVLGGGLVEAMPELFVEEARRSAGEHAMSVFKDSFKIVPAALGDDATVLGAAAWARHEGGDE